MWNDSQCSHIVLIFQDDAFNTGAIETRPQQWSDYGVVTAPPSIYRCLDSGNQSLLLGKRCSGDPHTAHIGLELIQEKIRF